MLSQAVHNVGSPSDKTGRLVESLHTRRGDDQAYYETERRCYTTENSCILGVHSSILALSTDCTNHCFLQFISLTPLECWVGKFTGTYSGRQFAVLNISADTVIRCLQCYAKQL
jgi:hypothetical protein